MEFRVTFGVLLIKRILLFRVLYSGCLGISHRPLSSSFLVLPYRILNIYHKQELLRGLWVGSIRFRV